DRASIVATCRIKLALAFEDHRDVRRHAMAAAHAMDPGDAEHEPQPATLAQPGPGKSQTNASLIRPRTAIALQIAILPVDVEVVRAAQARAQVAIVSRQATRCHRVRCGRGARRGVGTRCVARAAADARYGDHRYQHPRWHKY